MQFLSSSSSCKITQIGEGEALNQTSISTPRKHFRKHRETSFVNYRGDFFYTLLKKLNESPIFWPSTEKKRGNLLENSNVPLSNFKTALVSWPAFELSASLSSCWLSEPPLQGSRCRWSGPEPVASRRRPGSGPDNKQLFFKRHLFFSCFGPPP